MRLREMGRAEQAVTVMLTLLPFAARASISCLAKRSTNNVFWDGVCEKTYCADSMQEIQFWVTALLLRLPI
jgi:hypothetical protein